MKKLSIVVATYNRAPYLLRTLESLARQTLSPGPVSYTHLTLPTT